MDLNIQTTAKPAITRASTSEPNPFDGMFPTEEGKALTVTLEGYPTADDAKKAGERVQRLARQAANATTSEDAPEGYTARSLLTVDEVKDGRKTSHNVTVTVWSTDREKRPGSGRKPGNGNGNATA